LITIRPVSFLPGRLRLHFVDGKQTITRDDELPALGRPFGIQIITPREWLVRRARPF
jgi:hypothetical protein